MSESITNDPSVAAPTRHGWLITATVGASFSALAMVTIALVMLDKRHFGWMVGTWFLEVISAGMMVGGFILILGAWNLPSERAGAGFCSCFGA
jgi:hypothetical protein